MRTHFILSLCAGLALCISGCVAAGGVPPELPALSPPPPAAAETLTPTQLPPPVISTARPTPAPTLTPTASPSPTPDPYAALTIEHLAGRAYGDGEIRVEQILAAGPVFTRTLITYPSDGLTIYGFMNVPRGPGPFPVVVALHGYIDPGVYTTLDYTTRYADVLARAGYLVIHPNLRGFPPSDAAPDPFRVGMAVDVLNLVALVGRTAGQPGPLARARGDRIGLWGHSMGGGVSIRTITVNPSVRAAVLYGSMSGDEARNFAKIYEWSNGGRGAEELRAPAEALLRISPIYHLERVQAAVSIHHGEADELVPLAWSVELCERLRELEKIVECFTYPDQPHTFGGSGDQLFIQRSIEFFERFLKAP